MNRSQIIALYDQEQRKDVAFPGMRREVTPTVVRLLDTSGSGEGFIAYSQLTEGSAEEEIREQVSFFERIGQDFEWKVYDYDRPPDLKERLATYGFTVQDAEALLVLDLEEAPDILWQPVYHQVRRIREPEELIDVQTIEQQVWDEDASWVFDFLGSPLRHNPDQLSVYVAYSDNQPASAAWTYFQQGSQFASLWGGATISNFRRKGLYTALLAARAQEARSRRVRYLCVEAMPMSRPILEKLGFVKLAYTFPCKWKVKTQEQRDVV